MKDSRRRALHDAIAAMQVGDCLQWDIPDDQSARNMAAAISFRHRERRTGRCVRTLFRGRRAFIVRLA